jgi:UDPglucose 6-dehydrogenase
MRPDRIVIGADDEQALHLMRGLYAPFQRNHERLVTMDVRSAELTKYAANAMLATRISFMNELANLAELLGADIESVRKGIGSDPRIGYDFLYAGCGYGGSCFPKDVKALITSAQAKDYDLKVLNAVELANDAQKQVLLRKIKRHFKDNLQGKHFALWGLAFKPNTDDMREAPSRIVIEHFLAAGATVSAYDPVAIHEAKRIFKDVAGLTFGENQNTVLKNADALVIVTEWKEFRSPDFSYIKQQLKSSVVFDGRNLYAPKLVAAHGIDYYPIGR